MGELSFLWARCATWAAEHIATALGSREPFYVRSRVLDLLGAEVDRSLALLGVPTVDGLRGAHARLLRHR